MKNSLILIASLAFFPLHATAALEELKVSSETKFPSPRWIYGIGKAPSGKDAGAMLAQVKAAEVEEQYPTCVSRSRSARPKAKSLEGWLYTVELSCGAKAKPSVGNASEIWKSVDALYKTPELLLAGAHAPKLRTATVTALLAALEQDVKTNRTRGWRGVERLQSLQPYMDSVAKSKLWRSAAELAFIQQKLEAARDFLKRSLAEADSDETRQRLSAIEAALAGGGVSDIAQAAKAERNLQKDPASSALEASKEELELVDRITVALKGGELVAAMEDATNLIRGYPGGVRAKWASDRVIDTLTSLSDKSDPKYALLREQVVKTLEKADADRLAEWGRFFYNKGHYAQGLTLSRKSLETLDGARRTKVLELAVDAAIATEQWDVAHAFAKELIEKHAGTPSGREGLLRSGLISYRKGEMAQAVADFERLLALPVESSQEVIARHWLWRALAKQKSDRANQAAIELMNRFPFSYYGLRARIEQGKGALEFKPETKKTEAKLWLTGTDRMAWEKVQLLLAAGWLDEAQTELRELPSAMKADDKAIRGLVWAAAGGYVTASRLVNEAWDEDGEFRRSPFTEAGFPREFSDFVKTEAGNRRLDPDLVRGLIKQESSYNVRAVSTSNALGLMQMIPPTAKEIAQDLKLGNLSLPNDMFEPKRNVQMGTYYLSRMVNKYSGHVPLALAAYNAGPGRMDRWLASRPSLRELAKSRTSNPDDEIWFDEIPYSETSFYVKAILRNLILYKVLDQGRVEFAEPMWSFVSNPK